MGEAERKEKEGGNHQQAVKNLEASYCRYSGSVALNVSSSWLSMVGALTVDLSLPLAVLRVCPGIGSVSLSLICGNARFRVLRLFTAST